MAGRRKRRRRARAARGKGLSASAVDPLWLYERSVQDTEVTIELLDRIYEGERGRKALTLREDFCGTALLCADWVRSDPRRRAVGLDIDRPTLEWGARNNVEPLGADAERVTLLERDVLLGAEGRFDIVAAFNFSYFAFHDRATLLGYFSSVRESLEEGGVMVLDLHGGPDSQFELEEETELDGFTYVWEQGPFDPINNRSMSYIHYRFPDGTEIRRAFAYDWRIWSIPELRDALRDAGFSRVVAWWDCEDDVIRPRETAANLEAWVTYLAAWK